MGRLLCFLQSQPVRATVVVPAWPSAVWWPVLCPTGGHFAPWVMDVCVLPRSAGVFLQGTAASNALGQAPSKWPILALSINTRRHVPPGSKVPVPPHLLRQGHAQGEGAAGGGSSLRERRPGPRGPPQWQPRS